MAYGDPNIDPVLASMGMPYGGSVSPMGGGMGAMGSMGPSGMFGGMGGMGMGMGMPYGGMPYGPSGVPSAPLPPGVSNASANRESSPFGAPAPTSDNFNGKMLLNQNEKKKHSSQNFMLAAGIVLSSVVLLALSHGRGNSTLKRQAAEEAEELRASNRKKDSRLSKASKKSEKQEQAIKNLKRKNAVQTEQLARKSQSGNIHRYDKNKIVSNDMLKHATPQQLADMVTGFEKAPQTLDELEKLIQHIKLRSKAGQEREQANELFRAIIQKSDSRHLPLIQEIGTLPDHLPNAVLESSKIGNSQHRAGVLTNLFQRTNWNTEITYPKYDLNQINETFKNRNIDAVYPQETKPVSIKQKQADGTVVDSIVQKPHYETGTVGSFLQHYKAVLEKDVTPARQTEQTQKIADLQRIIDSKKQLS